MKWNGRQKFKLEYERSVFTFVQYSICISFILYHLLFPRKMFIPVIVFFLGGMNEIQMYIGMIRNTLARIWNRKMCVLEKPFISFVPIQHTCR